MGLDTYAAQNDTDLDPRTGRMKKGVIAELTNVFGYHPGFRGSIWDGPVQRLTGESLYQEWIPSSVVERMLASMERAVRCSPITLQGQMDREVAIDLIPFFRVCVANNLGLVGDW